MHCTLQFLLLALLLWRVSGCTACCNFYCLHYYSGDCLDALHVAISVACIIIVESVWMYCMLQFLLLALL